MEYEATGRNQWTKNKWPQLGANGLDLLIPAAFYMNPTWLSDVSGFKVLTVQNLSKF